jgi:hypothetical protein
MKISHFAFVEWFSLDLSIPACMPFRKISQDLKLAAVRLHKEDLLPQHSILDALSISCSTFYRILNLWETTGDVVKHPEIHDGPSVNSSFSLPVSVSESSRSDEDGLLSDASKAGSGASHEIEL